MWKKFKYYISYFCRLFVLLMSALSGFSISRGDNSGFIVISVLFIIVFVINKLKVWDFKWSLIKNI